MKRLKGLPLIFAFLLLCGGDRSASGGDRFFGSTSSQEKHPLFTALPVLKEALKALNLQMEDLKFERKNAPTTWRLKVVDDVLDDPLLSPILLSQYSGTFRAGIASTFFLATELLEFSPASFEHLPLEIWAPQDLPSEIKSFLEQLPRQAAFLNTYFSRWQNRFPRDAYLSLPYLLVEEPEEIWKRLSAPEQKWDTEQLLNLLEQYAAGPAPPNRSPDMGSAPIASDPLVAQTFSLILNVLRFIEESVPSMKPFHWGYEPMRYETPLGFVLISSSGDDVVTCWECAIIIDPGGNDRYYMNAGTSFPTRIIIDLDGNDSYFSDDGGIANGFFGLGMMIDLAGNDRYETKNFGLGAGYFGAGILWDLQGDDEYFCSVFCMGAGGFGIGILKDDGGNDTYRAAEFAQGFAFTQGVGMLLDRSGNDSYYAGGVIMHRPLYSDAYRSLSQGFSIGMRGSEKAGGVGILWDSEGNDTYRVEVYGQGAGYWYSWGALIDEAGRDSYSAVIYCQGAGIHLAVGTLMDFSGDDLYSCTDGVGMGGGHDWAVGVLTDFAGNDYYSGAGITQGGGNANGVGILIDFSGNDAYSASKDISQGWGNPARDSFSLGILIDLAGKDFYTHGGKNAAMWSFGFLGIGVDQE